MKAPSHHLHSEHLRDPARLAGPFAAVLVALAGAAVVVGAMLLVSVSDVHAGRFIPDFAALQSLIIG
jgi:hypothetical protein